MPVRPPAPVTTILVFEEEDEAPEAAAMTETAVVLVLLRLLLLRQRSARLSRSLWRCSSVTKAEAGAADEDALSDEERQRGVEVAEREEVEEKDPLALERREAARARILGAPEAGAALARERRAGCVLWEKKETGGGGFELGVWRKKSKRKQKLSIGFFFQRSHLSFSSTTYPSIRTWEARARR